MSGNGIHGAEGKKLSLENSFFLKLNQSFNNF